MKPPGVSLFSLTRALVWSRSLLTVASECFSWISRTLRCLRPSSNYG